MMALRILSSCDRGHRVSRSTRVELTMKRSRICLAPLIVVVRLAMIAYDANGASVPERRFVLDKLLLSHDAGQEVPTTLR